MKLQLIRKYFKKDYTIGVLLIDSKYYCDTLELPKPIEKGTYKIFFRNSPKFNGNLMPTLKNVPHNSDVIMIHIGNTVADTKGCILVGQNKVKGKVINSKLMFEPLYNQMLLAYQKKEELIIEIK